MASAGSGGTRVGTSALEVTTFQQLPDPVTSTQSPAIPCTDLGDDSDYKQVTSVTNVGSSRANNQGRTGANLHQSGPPQNLPSTQTPRSQCPLSRPPSYDSSVQQRETRVGHQALFLPYVTQELPRYTEVSDSTAHSFGEVGEIQVGFVRQAGGQCVPIQIPGYIQPTPHTSRLPALVQMHHGAQASEGGTRFTVATRRNPEDVPTNYFKLTFFLLIFCTLHLNIPAIFMLLTALFFSIKVKEKHADRQYSECKRYSNLVLICNYLAIVEYIVLIIGGFTILLLIFVVNVKISL